MLTPAMVVEMWKSSRVICRAQPPFWMRLGARLNEAQNCGMPLTSVAGGLRKLGSWPASPGSCGPGSVNALGLVTLTAPSGGRSGLPKPPAARAAAVRAANPPAASIARRERFALIISLVISTHASKGCFGVSFMTRDYQFHSLPQSSKVWPPSVDPTSNPASARGRYRYSLLFYFSGRYTHNTKCKD